MARRQQHRREMRARGVLEMARGVSPQPSAPLASLMGSSLGALPWGQLAGGKAPTPEHETSPSAEMFSAVANTDQPQPASAPAPAPPMPAPMPAPQAGPSIQTMFAPPEVKAENQRILAMLQEMMPRSSGRRMT